jgi:hypothetical protein
MERNGLKMTVISSVITLSGCGGGSSSVAPSNLTSAPGEAALSSYSQANHQGTLTATHGGNTYTLQYSDVPDPGTTTFNGNAPAYSDTTTITLSTNGTQLAESVSTSYYLLNPYVPLGSAGTGGIPYGVVTSSYPIPTTLTVGASGSFANVTDYHDSSMASLDANETATYSVQAHDASSLLFCTQTVTSNTTAQGSADGFTDDTETDCYAVTAAGVASLFSITLTANGTTLTFQ